MSVFTIKAVVLMAALALLPSVFFGVIDGTATAVGGKPVVIPPPSFAMVLRTGEDAIMTFYHNLTGGHQ